MKRIVKKHPKKKKKRTRADIMRIAVIAIVIGTFLYTFVSQQIRITEIRRETKQCEAQTASQKEEYGRLEKKAEYNSTDDYYEDKAKDEGYVYEDEIVFVVGN